MVGGPARANSTGLARRGKPFLGNSRGTPAFQTNFQDFSNIVDTATGALNFKGKASINENGVNFSNGASFSVRMEDFEQLGEELGRGNYGTVNRVLYKPKKLEMAIKQIRVELDSTKFKTIITELNILQSAVAPSILMFWGAFYSESCVNICVEYMDGGDVRGLTAFKLGEQFRCNEEIITWEGLPEDVLSRILGSTVRGLKFLKDKLEVIHRDVKPTNILANTKGQIKLCDFGVSGFLERSKAQTVIGCQIYMAPERIYGGTQEGYGVASDIWSLAISALELAMGKYPYDNPADIMGYMRSLIEGRVPPMPDQYSKSAQEWVASCLHKEPQQRATYRELLDHPFLQDEETKDIDMVSWVASAMRFKEARAANKEIRS
ncbi:MAP kinase [Cylindrobasidium torrendii FP15055 ss-10]|uniref:mitogen-activated protein kinase kinase n=1 Tax=Cylindrobasidium torrendii FP15055 ss-10 TaxID=1314674 RepID=A0A0D7BVA4_9AGAR|nr:MAP kinase [Cylindrobasidium torrendii FP15055 ss-10]